MFNRRRQAAGCATLIVIGLIILNGGHARTVVGVAILGIAYAWAFGSSWRPVHWAFVGFGLLLLIGPIGDVAMWPHLKPQLIELQANIVQGERDSIAWDEQHSPIGSDFSRDHGDLAVDESRLARLKAEGLLGRMMDVDEDWQLAIGSLLLLCSGVGLLIGVKPRPPEGHLQQAEPPRLNPQ